MKKLVFIIFAVIMITMSVFSVGYVASAETSGTYYVGETWFSYDIETYFGYTNLRIKNFSDDFSRKVTIPDEIDGVKIETVIIEDYQYIETLILSDGIQGFTCYYDQGDEDHMSLKNRETNNIKYLYLGKDFAPSGMQQSKINPFSRLESLRMIYVSEENQELISVSGMLYSKDSKKVVMAPEKHTYFRKYGNVTKLPKANEICDYAYAYTGRYEEVNLTNVDRIGMEAFSHSEVKEVTINKRTSYVGALAFSGCEKLKTVTIKGNSEKVFGTDAFGGCKRLNKVVIKSKKIPEFKTNTFAGTKKGIKFYLKNKKLAKELKTALKKTGVDNAKIYVGKTLIYKGIK